MQFSVATLLSLTALVAPIAAIPFSSSSTPSSSPTPTPTPTWSPTPSPTSSTPVPTPTGEPEFCFPACFPEEQECPEGMHSQKAGECWTCCGELDFPFPPVEEF